MNKIKRNNHSTAKTSGLLSMSLLPSAQGYPSLRHYKKAKMRLKLSENPINHAREIKNYKAAAMCGENCNSYVPKYLIINIDTWYGLMGTPDFQRNAPDSTGRYTKWAGMRVCMCGGMKEGEVILE
jgi:hypothetical protein